MKNVEDAVKQLTSAIKESDIYLEYEKQLKAQIDEFRMRNFKLQTGGDNAFDKLEQFEDEYAEFRENPLVNDFLASELAFCRMMQEINRCIMNSVDFE